MSIEQPDLFAVRASKHQVAFEAWKETTAGGMVVNRFIRIAIGFHRRGQRIGAKAMAERLRWNAFCRKQEGEKYLINNVYVASMARFAMERVAELREYFEIRQIDQRPKEKEG